MKFPNKYSIRKSRYNWQRRLRIVQLVFGLLLIGSIAGGRFVIDQALTFQASNQSPNVTSLEQPEPLQVADIDRIETAELIEVDIDSTIQTIIDDFVENNSDANIGIAVNAIDGSFTAGVNQEQQFDAASLYKTLASYKVLQMVDAEELSLSQLTSAGLSIEECIRLAITVSDNPCGIALQSLSDPSSTDLAALDWGYSQSSLSGYYPQTSAIDQHRLFKDIYEGNRLSNQSRDLLLGFLSDQQILNRTPEYDDATLYLKTGDLGNVVNSAALVETSSSIYTISVLTDNWGINYLSKYSEIEDIHKEIHEAITANERPQ